MVKCWKTACMLVAASALACCLFACSSPQGSQGSQESESSQGSLQSQSQQGSAASDESGDELRESILAKLASARDASYDNATFGTKTETIVTEKDDEGQDQQQIITSTMSGEIDRSGATPRVHMSYEETTSARLEKSTYDMFIDASGMIVKEGDALYKDEIDEESLQSYAASFSEIASEESVTELLDMSSDYNMTESDGETTITITMDVNKLEETPLVDISSLPEGSSIATFIASYSLDSENRLKAVRLSSSTTGYPTYRVDQKYWFSDYDTTVLPEWPDVDAYMEEQAGIMTDEDGNKYFVDEEGVQHTIESIDPDGTVNYL